MQNIILPALLIVLYIAVQLRISIREERILTELAMEQEARREEREFFSELNKMLFPRGVYDPQANRDPYTTEEVLENARKVKTERPELWERWKCRPDV